MSTKSPRNDNAGRNRKITKFALAGVAVLGVGAALTSAAWTDNVFFSAAASSSDIDFEGSLNGSAWFNGEAGNLDLVVPSTVFDNLSPNDSLSVTLYVRNNGAGALTIQSANVLATGDLFSGAGYTPATATAGAFTYADADTSLASGEVASFPLTITTPNWVQDEATNDTGFVVINVQATT